MSRILLLIGTLGLLGCAAPAPLPLDAPTVDTAPVVRYCALTWESLRANTDDWAATAPMQPAQTPTGIFFVGLLARESLVMLVVAEYGPARSWVFGNIRYCEVREHPSGTVLERLGENPLVRVM